jgi:hypothetical protein
VRVRVWVSQGFKLSSSVNVCEWADESMSELSGVLAWESVVCSDGDDGDGQCKESY